MPSTRIRVLLCDDHELVRKGLMVTSFTDDEALFTSIMGRRVRLPAEEHRPQRFRP